MAHDHAPPDEELGLFLHYIREGHDRPTAAYLVNPIYTGTLFKRLVNQESSWYDPEFAAAYAEACVVRGPLKPNRMKHEAQPSRFTMGGMTKALALTDIQLQQFLDAMADGNPPAAAARKVDPPTSLLQLNSRRRKDPEFAEAWKWVETGSIKIVQENIRAKIYEVAMAGDYKALSDLAKIHLPEWQVLLTNRHVVGHVDMRQVMAQNFEKLDPAQLDQLITMMEEQVRNEQKQIPAVIEGHLADDIIVDRDEETDDEDTREVA